MNHKELLKELEKQMARYGYCDTRTHIELFIKEYEALTKDEKPIRLKDVIKRIKGFDNETKFKWTYDILQELGSDFSTKMFHEGYQQGRFDEALETHHEPEKVKVPQFVAEYIEQKKNEDYHLLGAMTEIRGHKNKEIYEWFWDYDDNMELFARAWVDGYEVEPEPEKEKRYYVRFKGADENYNYLTFIYHLHAWVLGAIKMDKKFRSTHTRKELEDAGFGEVFNSPLFEVEEVE